MLKTLGGSKEGGSKERGNTNCLGFSEGLSGCWVEHSLYANKHGNRDFLGWSCSNQRPHQGKVAVTKEGNEGSLDRNEPGR